MITKQTIQSFIGLPPKDCLIRNSLNSHFPTATIAIFDWIDYTVHPTLYPPPLPDIFNPIQAHHRILGYLQDSRSKEPVKAD